MEAHVLRRVDTEPKELDDINYNSDHIDRELDWDAMKKLVQAHDLEEIRCVDAGLIEDWPCTAAEVWREKNGWAVPDGGYFKSFWATPVFIIEFIDGSTETYECYVAKERTNGRV
jgi:hypothetical protein